MDDSDAPTDAAIDKHHMMARRGSAMSFLTTDFQEHDDFSTLASLSGRGKQIEAIQAAYDRVTKGVSEAVLIHGVSGTGKSSLVEFMREVVTKDDGGYFVSGKFDQLVTRKEPFSAIAAAFSDICDLIIQSSQLEERRTSITAALGPDIQVLSRVISNIKDIAEQGDAEDNAPPPTSINSDDFTRFRLACQQFLRAVATEEHPLLIFLDDLQWADEMSVRLIKSFIKDSESHHMLLCVAYRGDEVDGKVLLELNGEHESSSPRSDAEESQRLPFTDIEVGNLDTDDLCSMLAQLLHMGSDTLRPLASLLLEKTKGNPNAVVQLLEHLKTKKLLTFSHESFSWEWNMFGIESEVSDNPTEIIAQKIGHLDEDVQETLKLAAYMGHSFDVEVLQCIVSGENCDGQSDVTKHLEVSTTRGLTEARGKGMYRFTHDSNQHFLYNLVQEEKEREMIHLRIGRIFVHRIPESSDKKESLVFLAASNLARGAKHIDNDEERLDTIQLFFDTATLAASKVALVDASEYLACAMNLLKEGDNPSNYELYMNVHHSYAEVQNCTGFFEESNRAVDTIMRQAKLPKDRFRAQCTKLQSLVYQQKHDEMAEFAFKNILKSLGVSMPMRPSKIQVVVELVRTKLALRKVEARDFLSMPVMENEKILSVIKVLNIMGPVIFHYSDKGLYLVSTLRQVRYALKYGISPNTPGSIVLYAMVQLMMGKPDDAYKLGKVSVDLSSREENLASRAICLACTGLFIYSVRDRMDTLLDPFLESFQIGMAGGSDFGAAFFGIAGYLDLRFHLGTPLAELDNELKRYCQQMKELQAHRMRSYQLPRWQHVKKLRGLCDDPIKLVGDVLNADEQLKLFQATDDTIGRFITNLYRLKSQASFEEWDLVEETLPLLVADVHALVGSINYNTSITDIVMASLQLFENTGKKKHCRIAKKFTKVLEKAHNAGAPVAKPLFMLVKAEWKAVVDDEDARDDYDAAIEELVSHKLVAYETMAYHRAMHLMIRQTNTRKARDYLAVSLERHRKWGSVAKAEYLESQYTGVMKSVKPAYEVEVTKTVPEDEPCFLHIGR